MEIRNNVHFDGAIQSIEHVDEDGTLIMSVGIVKPGEYTFGPIKQRETIRVTSGKIWINGVSYVPHRKKPYHAHPGLDVSVLVPGNQCVVEAEGMVVMVVEEVSSYVCHFG